MCENCTEIKHALSVSPRAPRGFTMVELVVVLVLVSVTSIFILPKLTGALSMRDSAWRDQVLSAMRYAQKGAVGHRRLVCATVGTASITLTIATVNPATTCGANFIGLDGSNVVATTSNSSAATSVSPSGVIYFQPDGRVTSDGAGTTASTRTISMSGATDITVNGETGYVQ
jgi:MSHA pilin protein MshC